MKLVRRVGRDISITESDTLQIKAALVKMGKYEVPSYGITPYPDQAMIEGIRSLQSDLGVDPTGSIRPGGPEEAALTVAAEGGSGSGGGTVHVHSYTQERHGNDVRVVEHVRSAPRGGRSASGRGAAFDTNKFIDKLDEMAGAQSKGICAKRVREALEAGGLDSRGHPASAKDWGGTLEANDFLPVDEEQYVPQVGDVVVIQPVPGASSQDGHIAAFDGTQWVSDFKQTDFWPGPGYRRSQPPYVIYRHGH